MARYQSAMRTRPLIGVTLDSEPAGGWSKLPWYALRQNYFDAVVAAGGLPVFAHPLARRRGPVVGDEVVAAMAGAGMVGLEVNHPDHDADDTAHAAALAADLSLIGTGSSDYHGTNKPTPIGARLTDPTAYEQLLALPAALAPVT